MNRKRFKLFIMKQLIKNTHGFTLMEVLIATAILAIVLTIVYGSFVQTKRVIARAEGSVDELRGVRVSFNRMMWDLSMAFLSKQGPDQTDVNTIFVGTDDFAAGYPNDSIDFTSYANRIRNKDARESDQTEVGYYLNRNFEGDTVLMKREKRQIDKKPLEGGKSFELSEDVVGLNFRYLDQGAWVDSWDSRVSKAIPEAVEITLIIKDRTGRERSYRTVTGIPLGGKS
ncbi:MAG: prepilin-type N-terminal cleavage/methylation domain-containing protein [Nitrospirae bacterium]|nr:prepilin-type N-terminal cleavage/methylation domain-containing protein [Nitrospirota bacterium]